MFIQSGKVLNYAAGVECWKPELLLRCIQTGRESDVRKTKQLQAASFLVPLCDSGEAIKIKSFSVQFNHVIWTLPALNVCFIVIVYNFSDAFTVYIYSSS